MIYALNATSQSLDIFIADDSGLAVTGLVAATFPTLTYSRAGANADVAFPALSDLATIGTAYASGGVKERGDGVYRLDVPDAIFTSAGFVTVRGEASGKHVIVPKIEVSVTVGTVTNAVDTNANATETAIKAKTDNLPSDPADASDIAAAFALIPAAVWANGTRTLSAFAFSVTVGTNNDKTGYSLTVAPPTAAEIDTQLTGSHGSGSWVDVGGGSGARTRTVTVVDDAATPLENATVRLTNGITTAMDRTDASGVAHLFVDDATWDLAVTKDGYEPDAGQPETVVVSANGDTDYVLVANVIPAPADPSRATVYADFARILPTLPPNKIDVRFTLIADDATINDAGIIIADRVFTTRPDADGHLEIELDRTDLMTPAGAQWRVECPTANLDATFNLDAATFDLATLIT